MLMHAQTTLNIPNGHHLSHIPNTTGDCVLKSHALTLWINFLIKIKILQLI